MKRLATLFILSALPALANSCVGPASAGTVNWHTAAWTSCGGTFPGNGDTVLLSAGTTMVCEVSQTCTVGTSPVNGGTTALSAVTDQIAANLTVNGTLIFRGPVIQCHLCDWRASAGGSILHDSSLSATPLSTHYTWHLGFPPGSTYTTPIVLTLTGTSGSHVTFGNAGGSGYFGGFTVEFGDSGYPLATYTDFAGCGSVKTALDAMCMNLNAGNSADAWVLDHVTVDAASGGMYSFSMAANASITFQYVNWLGHSGVQDCGGCDTTVYLDRIAGWVSGSRIIKNSNFNKEFVMYGVTGDKFTKFTISDSMVPAFKGISLQEYGITQTNNVYYEILDGGDGTTCCSSTGLLLLTYSQHSNFEVQGGQNQVIDGEVVEALRPQADGNDQFQVEGAAGGAAGNTYTMKNVLFLPAFDGSAEGTVFNFPPHFDPTGATVSVHHGTFSGNGWAGGPGFGVFEGVGGENNNLRTGMFTAVKDNIMWRPAGPGAAYLTGNARGTAVANATWTFVDYNAFYQVTSGYYYSPGGVYTYYGSPNPPGTHDLTSIDPNWIDQNRIVLLYDQQYLGRALGTAWSNSTTYSIGNIVSNTHSGYWSNAATNWTCVKAVLGSDSWATTTSGIWAAMTSASWALLNSGGGSTEPGVGADWLTYWEPAAVTEIRNGLLAGTTKADGAIPGCTVASPCSASALATGWLKRGYMPRNPVIRTAGDDGLTVGAVAMDQIMTTFATP